MPKKPTNGFGTHINKALEKDRDLRYQVASEMRSDLKRLKRSVESRARARVSCRLSRNRRGATVLPLFPRDERQV